MSKRKRAEELSLVSFESFQKTAKQVLSNSNREPDKRVAALQPSNAKEREAKKKR
jgi:hypothetical protein